MNNKLLIMLIMSIMAACPNVQAAYGVGFARPGYVLYLGATEYQHIELMDASAADVVELTSSNPAVLTIEGMNLIPHIAGEVEISAHLPNTSSLNDFTTRVKVIDPSQENELFIRAKYGDIMTNGCKGVITARNNDAIGIPHYTTLTNASSKVGSNIFDTFGDGEIIFCNGTWVDNAILTFSSMADGYYNIVNKNQYLHYSNGLKFGQNVAEQYFKATIDFDEQDFVKIHFESTPEGCYLHIDKSVNTFKYNKITNQDMPELYIQKTVKFEAPDGQTVRLCIDDVSQDSDDIKLGDDNEHELSFTDVPDGAYLYYKLNSTATTPPQERSEAEENSEWTRYDSPFTVTRSVGGIEYYVESHGLQSAHVSKIFTLPTDVSRLKVDPTEQKPSYYFDLNGNRIPFKELKPGVYIKRNGSRTEKIVI